jgi:hypothetical protein
MGKKSNRLAGDLESAQFIASFIIAAYWKRILYTGL